MKPLDLTKPVQLRDGRPVRIVCTDADSDHPIIGYIPGVNVNLSYRWRKDGTASRVIVNSGMDLVNAPEPFEREIWANIYGTDAFSIWTNKEGADAYCGPNRIACVKITIKGNVGDGL